VGVFGLLGVLAIWGLYTLFVPENEADTHPSYQNRTWLADTWTTIPPSAAAVRDMAEQLQNANITMIYVKAGAWRADGSYRQHEYAQEFRRQLATIAPQIKVLAWDWVVPDLYNDDDSHLELTNFADLVMKDYGYDGFHLQGFSVFDGNPNYVRLVRALDAVMDTYGGYLSITVPPDRRPADPAIPLAEGNPAVSWTPRYKQQLGLIVDEMVIMAHASGITTVEDYEKWFAYQIEVYAEDIRRVNEEVSLIVALPVHPAEDLHDPTIENIATALTATQKGIQNAGNNRSMIRGVGIYSFDNATPADWAVFRREWIR
jgi:hypothetical protein